MNIDFNQEGFLFNTSDTEGTSNAAHGDGGGAPAKVKDIREERPIYVPNHLERAELEKEINKFPLDEMAEQYAPYLAIAKKYKLYTIDTKGRKVYPYEISKVFTSGKVLKKDWVTFYAVLSHPSNIFLFLNELSEKEITLLQNIAINHCMFVKDAKELTGKTMTGERRGKSYWSKEVAPLPEYHMFLQIGRAFGPDSRYSYTRQYFFELRKNIRRELLQTIFMDYLKMETVDTLPQEDSMKIYNAEASIFLNYPILTSLFESKQLELGKGKVTATTIKNVEKACNLDEFFPKGEKECARLCAHLIANTYTLFAAAKGIHKQRKIEDNIKAFFEDMFGYMYYLLPAMLSHLKGFRRSNMCNNSYCAELCQIIQSVVSKYAKDGWLSITDLTIKIRTFNEYAEKFCMILPIENYDDMEIENTNTDKRIYYDEVINNITHPFIKAYLFLMAAYGVVEIAYDEKTEEGDTCYYDTLRYVRLTDLGKYVFGITKKYEHQAAQKKKYFELDDSNLIIKSLDANNPYLSILNNMSIAISKRMYKVTYESFLYGCTSLTDIINKEKLFRDYICKEPPANWDQFFKDIKTRCNPMNISKKKYIVMEIPTDNKELQRIILSDPIISKYSIKAEGYLLLVEVSNRIKVATALKKYGYLL